MSKRIQDFSTATYVSTTDLLLFSQQGITKNVPVALLQTALVPPSTLASLSDVSVGNVVSGMVLSYRGNDWVPISVDFYDEASVQGQIASINNILSSIAGYAAQITSIDQRVTSVFSGLTSTDARVTSVQNGLVSVNARVTSIRTDVTSVENHVNLVSNNLSITNAGLNDSNARITSVQNGVVSVDDRVTSVYNYTSNQSSVLGARVTSLRTDISSVQAGVVSIDARVSSALLNITSISNNTSILADRITSVANNLSFNLVSLSDVSLATSIGSDGYAVVWDDTRNQFILSSVGGGGSGGSVAPLSVAVSNADGDGVATTVVFDTDISDPTKAFIFVEGIYQNKNTYSVSGGKVIFSSAVPLGVDEVELVYLGGGGAVGGGGTPAVTTAQFNALTSVVTVNSAGLTSVDSRVTSLSDYIIDLSSSFETRVNNLSIEMVSAQVSLAEAFSQSLLDFATGVASSFADVNNQVSVIYAAQINTAFALASLEGRVTTTSAALRADITSARNQVSGAITALSATLETRINTVSATARTDITSVYNYALNQTSISNAAFVSSEARTNSVSSLVVATSLALRSDITSVYNYAVNQTSVFSAALVSSEARTNSVSVNVAAVSSQLTTTSADLRADITSMAAALSIVIKADITSVRTALRTDITSVRNNVSVLSFDFFSGMIPVVSIQRYDLDRRCFRKYAVRSVFAATSTGQCTYSLRKNQTNLTGFTSVISSVNTSIVTSGTLVTIEVGDRFDLNITENAASASDFAFTVGIVKLF